MMETDNNLWTDAKCAALKVGFLTTKEELYMYAKAVYSAVMWGRESDETFAKTNGFLLITFAGKFL